MRYFLSERLPTLETVFGAEQEKPDPVALNAKPIKATVPADFAHSASESPPDDPLDPHKLSALGADGKS